MNRKSSLIGLAFITLLFLTLRAQAAPDTGITYEYKNGIATVTTNNVTISVNAFGNVPVFHFKTQADYGYTVLFKQLIEYDDANEDGVFQYNESLTGIPILSLTSMRWDFSDFVTEENAESEVIAVHFNFTSESMVGIYADFEMTIAAHLYLADQVIDGYELVGGAELKFDLYISGFPWNEDYTYLALRFDITPAEGSQIKNTHNQNIDTMDNTTNEEVKMDPVQNQVKQKLMIQDGEKNAFFGYANQSMNKYQYETQYKYGAVNASYSCNGEGVLQLFLSFDHFEELIYDPSVGTLDSGDVDATSIAWMSAVVLPIVAIAVIGLTRRNKK